MTNKHDDLIERIGHQYQPASLFNDIVDAIKELVAERDEFEAEGIELNRRLNDSLNNAQLWQQRAEKAEDERDEADKTSDEHLNARYLAEKERDELRKEVERLKETARFERDYGARMFLERNAAQALSAAIERETIERCAGAVEWKYNDATVVDGKDVMTWAHDEIRSLPLTADQSALDRIVDERTKELREAAWGMLEAFCVHEDSVQMAAADRLEEILSRSNGGKDES